ncbi:DEAD/DEAH box helicase [Paenibacillus sp. GCM10023248]|uniref:DEAD/DEAH box helicase n=1 Tax=unclassified Paenibacillus TaxID=185978 RepID=UPI002378497B|nr:ATP-binding protein [Paenibacillus sp. MAHUQ-63]MDD9271487.1 AAA domain-containing protein [Paenibacillus sp. MAHUQ-63]
MEAARLQFGKIRIGKFSAQLTELQVGDFIGITTMMDGQCYFQHKSGNIYVEPLDADARYSVQDADNYPDQAIHWIQSLDEKKNRVTVQSHLFPATINLLESIKIGVTDRALAYIRKDHNMDPLTFIRERFVFGNLSFCSLYGKDVKSTGAFTVMGAGYMLHVEKHYNNTWRVTKMRELKAHNRNQDAITLVKPGFTFTVESEASQNAVFNTSQLDQIVKEANGYLSIWDNYNTLEETFIKDRFAHLGRIRYRSVRNVPGSEGKRIAFGLEGEASDAWIEGELFDVEALPMMEKLSDDPFARYEVPPVPIGAVISVKRDTIIVELDGEADHIPHEGYLQLSVMGDRPRIRRRSIARDLILNRKAEIPYLMNLLEMTDFRVIQPRRQEPLDAQLAASLKPNQGQVEALDAALNSPDIAIIQGPPGTGKTRVIKAIVKRLYEINKDNPQFGVLISSYQHDAVDNAVDGLVVAGMPAVRFGGRRGMTQDFQDDIGRWIADKSRDLALTSGHYRENELAKVFRELKQLFGHWRVSPGGVSGTRRFLLKLEEFCVLHLGGHWPEKIQALLGSLSSFGMLHHDAGPAMTESERARLTELLSIQRTTAKAFDDDGAFAASRLSRFLSSWKDAFPSGLIGAVEAAASWEDVPVSENKEGFEEYVMVVEQLRKRAQSPIQEINLGQADVPHPLVEQFCVSMLDELKDQLSRTTVGISEALDDFIATLKSDPEGTRNMLRRYSTVAAATCQQSAQQDIEKERQSFDVVIIDEAARANPLDLFIPMVKGRKVILVGDQAQLPHVLERNIERELTKSEGATQDVISVSLFERLFEHFAELEKTTGIRRTARLNTQYRMNKAIGQFVADQFYDYEIFSEVDDGEKSHGLPMYGGKPIAWVDLPRTLGVEEGRQSYRRKVEVHVLFEHLERILRETNENAQLFTVGVITFYKNQVKELLEELDKRVFPEHWLNRIKIGTVDAFQGREFSAVLLSTVRSNPHKDIRRRVGFLELRNRLCVAFSRAQKLLVVFGDAETVAGMGDEVLIPSLHKFYSLCRGEDGYFERRARL